MSISAYRKKYRGNCVETVVGDAEQISGFKVLQSVL